MRSILLFIAVLFSSSTQAQSIAGPMLGPVTPHSATIWVQGDAPATVALEIAPQGSVHPAWCTTPASLEKETGFTARLDLDALAAGITYRYKLVWNGAVLDTPYQFTTLSDKTPEDFTLYLGSCMHLHDPETDGPRPWGGDHEILDRIASQAAQDAQPNLMLWLGDNLYFRADDLVHPDGMARRYQKTRSHPALQKLLAAMPHYAIWDDHDYGPNNSTRNFVHKQASLDLFHRYWPNPVSGLQATRGIFTRFSIADADFFLLDDRWYRDSDNEKTEPKVLYGAGQLAWLKNALLASNARFKIIAGGSQFLNDYQRFEGWQNFRRERGEFLDWLQQNKISGVALLSGDRHHTELLRLDRSGSYPIYELTCSPLTAGTFRVETAEANNPLRVAGTLVEARNFCTLSAEGRGDERRLILKSQDAQGKTFWRASIEAAVLE
jgi:alkaline phosphatase D